MDINLNTREVKYTKDKEPLVMDILLIKALGHFKLFECGDVFLQPERNIWTRMHGKSEG